MIDMPVDIHHTIPIEHVCEYEKDDLFAELNNLLILDHLVEEFKSHPAYNKFDPVMRLVFTFLKTERIRLEKKYNLQSKGAHQNHDREVQEQSQKEEFAVHDERYYNRHHCYDWKQIGRHDK